MAVVKLRFFYFDINRFTTGDSFIPNIKTNPPRYCHCPFPFLFQIAPVVTGTRKINHENNSSGLFGVLSLQELVTRTEQFYRAVKTRICDLQTANRAINIKQTIYEDAEHP